MTDNNDNDFSQIGYNSSNEDYTLPKYESNNSSLSSSHICARQ
jgi:hypothetical protein